ncbi:MAG TPA: MtrB/PioB family outer membrane beta-barrel protein [Vicinamibacterales bacterium]|nr:MtrB/PioB family outer membrane beta-barrel protein [Vicinamibacterales bacterium]
MRIRVLACVAGLALVPSTLEAQYPSMPAQSFLAPIRPLAVGQIDVGARVSGVEGDPARYQRYRDLRDGGFFDLSGLHRESDRYVLDAFARNIGWKDQSYRVQFGIPGRLRARFIYDQTPTFISRDTRTPYDTLPDSDGVLNGPLTLPDSVQALVQANPAANFRAAIEGLASDRFFSSRIRRDTLGFDLRYSMGDADARVKFQNVTKNGNIPYGAPFNIAIEVPLPIDSTAKDFGTSLEWARSGKLLRVGWDGSWYDNDAYEFIWDNPLRVTDVRASGGSSRGRLVSWPSNSTTSFNMAGAYPLPGRSSVNGTFAYGRWDQNAALPPHTINTAVAPIPLPRQTAEAKADSSSATLNFVTRPVRSLDMSARYRRYEFDNKTEEFNLYRNGLPERVALDGAPSVWTDLALGKLGPEHFSTARNYLDLDAGFTGLPFTTVKVGYSLYDAHTPLRVYEKVRDDTVRVGADVLGHRYVTFRSLYERTSRKGKELDLLALELAEEQPGMRHFDIAGRDRDRLTLLATAMPAAALGINASIMWTKDDFKNEDAPAESFGLQEYSSKSYAVGFDVMPREGVNAGMSFSYEDYGGLVQSRTASSAAERTNPTRNWLTDESQTARSLIASLDLLNAIENAEARFSLNYTSYEGSYAYGLVPGTTLTTPAPLPNLTSSETRAAVDVRYFLTRRVGIGFVYWFDRYQVTDWAFSPDIVSGVAQPPVEAGQTGTVNALLLNYFYRPYTSHTGWLRLTYVF